MNSNLSRDGWRNAIWSRSLRPKRKTKANNAWWYSDSWDAGRLQTTAPTYLAATESGTPVRLLPKFDVFVAPPSHHHHHKPSLRGTTVWSAHVLAGTNGKRCGSRPLGLAWARSRNGDLQPYASSVWSSPWSPSAPPFWKHLPDSVFRTVENLCEVVTGLRWVAKLLVWSEIPLFNCNPGSPLIHLRVSGKTTIVINSARAAIDLLEARSNIYSDRPRSHISTSSSDAPQSTPASMVSCLLRPFTWIFTPWSPRAILGDRPTVFSTSVTHPRFKKYRKLLQTSLNPRAVKKYTTLMEQERLVMLKSMLQSPNDFVQHVRR